MSSRQGRTINVRTNFFEVKSLPDTNIYHYNVTIIPEVPPILNRRIFQRFEELHSRSDLGRIKPVYDGHKNLYTAKPLPFSSATFNVIIPEDDGAPAGRRNSRSFNVGIKKVAVIDMEELHQFIEGKGSISNNILTGIMALNVLIRHRPSMMYLKIGKSFYTSQGSRSLYGGVEAWHGYFQSIKPTPGKLMINININAAAFYESGNLVQMAVKILEKRSVQDLRRITDRDRLKLEKMLKNLKIYVTYRGGKTYRRRLKITKLTDTSASDTKFEIDGIPTNVVSYFERRFNRRLLYPFLPCVVSRSTVILPMEACYVVEGQRYTRRLNDQQSEDMIDFTCQSPDIRASKIKQGLQILSYQQNEHMQQFGFQVSNDMAVVQARVLPTPEIQYHPSSREASLIPKGGSWNLRDKKVATGATLDSWACVVFGSDKDFPTQAVQHFLNELINTCQDTGMNIKNQTPPILYSNPQGNIEFPLKHAWLKAGNMAKSRTQLILCILPNTGVPLYAEIKRVGDTVLGVATQCIQSKHMLQVNRQYCANVCLKINVKLGGVNSFINPSQVPIITQSATILMGAYVIHPPPGNLGPSIAALCASTDAKASHYAASIRVQSARQEIIVDLASMVKELLKNFYQTCGMRPERILFYRGSIPGGQFAQVLKDEITSIRAACKALDVNYAPTITFVVVQSCDNTRFFSMEKENSDKSGNCLPGTVVESTITHPFVFNFYLQSHAGLQGTSRPIHYHVLYDENRFNPDSLQTLSYNLCYSYARCTRAVSIVPPVYYARLVCKRARFHRLNTSCSLEACETDYAAVEPELQKVMYFM